MHDTYFVHKYPSLSIALSVEGTYTLDSSVGIKPGFCRLRDRYSGSVPLHSRKPMKDEEISEKNTSST